MAHRRLLAATAALVAFAAVAPAHAGDDPVALVQRAVDRGVNDANHALDGIAKPGIIRDLPGGGGGGVVGGGFPPAGFTTTSIIWSMSPGQTTPAFTPPNPATSHPANWSCTTSTTATTAHAECTPTDPYDPGTVGWACYDPFVVADISTPVTVSSDPTHGGVGTPGATAASITGTSHCGTTSSTCTATTTPAGAGHCQLPAFPHQPAPLECDADFGASAPVATWTVRCAPIDP
jgi:hypothetical protein